jgi:hypothetical protein
MQRRSCFDIAVAWPFLIEIKIVEVCFSKEIGIAQISQQVTEREASVLLQFRRLRRVGEHALVGDEQAQDAGHDQQPDGNPDHQLRKREAALGILMPDCARFSCADA